MNDQFFMNLALKEAWKYQGVTYPNPAVGAVVVGAHGEILAIDAHKKAGAPHAEVLVLQEAYVAITKDSAIKALQNASDIHNYLLTHHNGCFCDCTIYTTLEPCSHIGKTPSCANLLQKLSIKRVVIGSCDTTKLAAGGRTFFTHVTTGISQEACDALIAPFMRWQNKNFIFFKWAQRLDGTIDDGIISSLESRTTVHQLRNRCDLLVIGGNTVRTDRPTLDSRLVGGRAPDVLIYSKQSHFDQSIPLFKVKDRRVYIESDFNRLLAYKNIMIEGGAGMFEATKEIVNYYLCFVAPSSGGTIPFLKDKTVFEYLHVDQNSSDIMIWLRKKR
jgi:diaminohydroxyphosphoribosylaminopyrimidine deaminase/5-amino-6-(5-phosphoribosylamino)uracil reductase